MVDHIQGNSRWRMQCQRCATMVAFRKESSHRLDATTMARVFVPSIVSKGLRQFV